MRREGRVILIHKFYSHTFVYAHDNDIFIIYLIFDYSNFDLTPPHACIQQCEASLPKMPTYLENYQKAKLGSVALKAI